MASISAGMVVLASTGLARAVDPPHYVPTSAQSTTLLTSSVPNPGTRLPTSNNYKNAEGPIYYNGSVYFGQTSDNLTSDLIWRYDTSQPSSTAVSQVVSDSGGTQGTYHYGTDQSGNARLITADRDSRKISVRSFTSTGSISAPSDKAISCGGAAFNGPNDLVADSGGGIYFTDPNFVSGRGSQKDENGKIVDGVYYIDPNNNNPATNTVRILKFNGETAGAVRPNGIILSPDQKTLYVALWGTGVIKAYTITGPGTLADPNGTTFVSVGSPDGLTMDPWGNLIVACSAGVNCYSSTYKVGDQPLFSITATSVTNVELSADGKTLFYTRSGYSSIGNMGLYSVPLTTVGVPEPASLALLALPAALLVRRRRK
jgi:sugar lactone lactonase YvrE